MNIPENTMISGEYTWVRQEGEYLLLGLNDNILAKYQEVLSVELPDVGSEIDADDYLVTVETAGGLLEVYAPVSGQVVEINDEIYDDPDLINMDPYGAGWLFVLVSDIDLN